MIVIFKYIEGQEERSGDNIGDSEQKISYETFSVLNNLK